MELTRRIIIAGAAAVVILGVGSAGAVAVASTLGVHDQPGRVQQIDPITTGGTGSPSPTPTATPTPTSTPEDSTPSGTTTVDPAPPVYLDDHGGDRRSGSDDGAGHDLYDDHGGDRFRDGDHDGDGFRDGDRDGSGHH